MSSDFKNGALSNHLISSDSPNPVAASSSSPSDKQSGIVMKPRLILVNGQL